MNDLTQFFSWSHLPPQLQEISQPIGRLAAVLNDLLPDNVEKDMMFRKLLEAKDCAVRARLFKKGESNG